MAIGITELVIIAIIIGVVIMVLSRRGGDTDVDEPLEITDAIHDPVVQDATQNGRKIEAIKQYRELTGKGLKESKEVIEYVMAGGDIGKKKRAAPHLDSAAGVRDLLNADRKEDAVELYARFAGVDEYTARDAVDGIEREMWSDDTLVQPGSMSPKERREIIELLRDGNKVEAIKRYRELSGLGLKAAKDAIEALE